MIRIARLLLITLLAGVLGACGSEKIDVMFECPSPSGQMIATVYRISNGDRALNQSMKINIRPSADAFDNSMDSFAFRHGYDAVIRWQSDSAMQIDYPADSEILHQEPVVFGTSQTFSESDRLSLIYRETPSTHGYFMVEKRCFSQPSE